MELWRNLAFFIVVVGGCGGRVPPETGPSSGGSTSGGPSAVVGWDDPTNHVDCQASPASYADYSTPAGLSELLIGRWRRCIAPQVKGEDVGVEFAGDGRWYALTWDDSHRVVRRSGIDYGGTWSYGPPGSTAPHFNTPFEAGYFSIGEVITSPPRFTNDPRQLRITFSPVLGIYLPMTP
jgi:hypothetical protein